MFRTGELENLICNAINIIVNKKIQNANYNYTIIATLETDDLYGTSKEAGKIYNKHCHLARYQDAQFEVYPLQELDIDEVSPYKKGDSVYVIVLNNDMTNPKFILHKAL